MIIISIVKNKRYKKKDIKRKRAKAHFCLVSNKKLDVNPKTGNECRKMKQKKK